MPRWLYSVLAAGLGIAAGLIYGWVINPVQFVDTTPGSLRADYRADYVLMVAESFDGNHDPGLASRRLAILGAEEPASIAEGAFSIGEEAGFSQADLVLIQQLTRGLQAYQPVPATAETAP